MMGGEVPAARVHGALITERHGRPSALQRPGSVEGQFLLYDRGIVFAASKLEDRMRQIAVVERLPGGQIRRVQRLPRGTRESGRRSFRDLRTLASATLRIDAGAESWIVETAHGRRLLGEIERLYGVRVDDPAAAPAAPSH